ncbi:MAG: lamin tail domain-containing protein, partial [FCB group bacterium]
MKLKYSLVLICLLILLPHLIEGKIVINEIMPAPSTNEPEWLELYNPDSIEVFIHTPKISDAGTTKSIPDISLKPFGYAILTKDTTKLLLKRTLPI